MEKYFQQNLVHIRLFHIKLIFSIESEIYFHVQVLAYKNILKTEPDLFVDSIVFQNVIKFHYLLVNMNFFPKS